jgi:protein SCO1
MPGNSEPLAAFNARSGPSPDIAHIRGPGLQMRIVLAGFALLILALPARAALTNAELDAVGVSAPPGAHLPLGDRLTDESGRQRPLADVMGGGPAVLIFADYTCRTLCGPALDFATQALAASGLTPGRDYRLVVVGLDPKDGAADAASMKRDRISDLAVADATTLLTGGADSVGRLTSAVGYRYAYDAEHDQYAHPAVVFVLTRDGKVARVLSELGMNGTDLRLALVEAGAGRIGTLGDHLRLLCYGFDPALGIYTVSIQRALMLLAALTLLVLALGIGWLVRRSPRPS